FPARNRIVAGICDAVVVVQAGASSGALITADFALEAGRPVLAVPGPPQAPPTARCHLPLPARAALCAAVADVVAQLPGAGSAGGGRGGCARAAAAGRGGAGWGGPGPPAPRAAQGGRAGCRPGRRPGSGGGGGWPPRACGARRPRAGTAALGRAAHGRLVLGAPGPAGPAAAPAGAHARAREHLGRRPRDRAAEADP